MGDWFSVLLTEPEAVIYALLCLRVSRIHAKEAGPSLGSIERYDWAGRINIVPDFIFTTHEPAQEQDRLCVELALPPGEGCSAVLWLTCTELTEPRGRVLDNWKCPFPFTKVGPFHCFPPRRSWCGTALLDVMFQALGFFCVRFIYFSPVVRQPVTSLKLVTFTSKHVEQSWSVPSQREDLAPFCSRTFRLHRKVRFSLYTGFTFFFGVGLRLQLFRWHSAERTRLLLHPKVSQAFLCTLTNLLPSFLSLSFPSLEEFRYWSSILTE